MKAMKAPKAMKAMKEIKAMKAMKAMKDLSKWVLVVNNGKKPTDPCLIQRKSDGRLETVERRQILVGPTSDDCYVPLDDCYVCRPRKCSK